MAFLDEAYRLLNLVEGAGDLARRVDAGAAGVVRLGFTAVSAISILGPLLRRLTAELPDVEVVLSERVTNAQVDGIRRGELDIGLARPPFDTSLLRSRVVLREPFMAVVPAAHPLAACDRPLTSDDFEGETVIGYNPDQSRYFHELSVRFFANAHPRIDQRVHQVLTAMLLVSAERGVDAGARVGGVAARRRRGLQGARPPRRRHAGRRRPRPAGRAARHLVARGGDSRRTPRARRGDRPGRLTGPDRPNRCTVSRKPCAPQVRRLRVRGAARATRRRE